MDLGSSFSLADEPRLWPPVGQGRVAVIEEYPPRRWPARVAGQTAEAHMIAHGGRVPDGYDENEDVDVVRRASHSYANAVYGAGMNYFGGLWSYADDELNSAPLSNSTSSYSSLDSTHGDIAMVFAVAGLHAVADTTEILPASRTQSPSHPRLCRVVLSLDCLHLGAHYARGYGNLP